MGKTKYLYNGKSLTCYNINRNYIKWINLNPLSEAA